MLRADIAACSSKEFAAARVVASDNLDLSHFGGLVFGRFNPLLAAARLAPPVEHRIQRRSSIQALAMAMAVTRSLGRS